MIWERERERERERISSNLGIQVLPFIPSFWWGQLRWHIHLWNMKSSWEGHTLNQWVVKSIELPGVVKNGGPQTSVIRKPLQSPHPTVLSLLGWGQCPRICIANTLQVMLMLLVCGLLFSENGWLRHIRTSPRRWGQTRSRLTRARCERGGYLTGAVQEEDWEERWKGNQQCLLHMFKQEHGNALQIL